MHLPAVIDSPEFRLDDKWALKWLDNRFWREIELEAENLQMVPPADADADADCDLAVVPPADAEDDCDFSMALPADAEADFDLAVVPPADADFDMDVLPSADAFFDWPLPADYDADWAVLPFAPADPNWLAVPPADAAAAADSDYAGPSDDLIKNILNKDMMWNGTIITKKPPDDSIVPEVSGQNLLRYEDTPAPTPDSDPAPDPDPAPVILPVARPVARPDSRSDSLPDSPASLDDEREPPEFRHAVDVAGTARRLLRDVAADHSYTLAKPSAEKQCFDNLGVQTPSDSEEEIDVVSVNEKSGYMNASSRSLLSCAPSGFERRHIQRAMASVMGSRRVPATPPATRKRRPSPPSSSDGHSPVGRKRARGPGRRPRRSSPDTDSDADVPDLEKRSLHNDMERMRRIGLKNLFDELKQQIPATRDKERAPKVVILREAACLCRRLLAEDREREVLRRQQARLLAKLKKLRSMHAAARSYAVQAVPPSAFSAH